MNFCMQNNLLSISNISLYGSQPSSVVFACKSATLGPKLHISIGPSPHLRISACKTACLASELFVSMGPSPHLWFLHAKERLLDPNNKSLWSQRSSVVLCMQYSVISNRITCLYRSQPLTVFFSGKTATFGQEQQVSKGPRHPLSFCAFKTG